MAGQRHFRRTCTEHCPGHCAAELSINILKLKRCYRHDVGPQIDVAGHVDSFEPQWGDYQRG